MRTPLTALALTLAFALAGCESEGPAERAGEKIDETVSKTGEKIEEATDSAGRKLEQVGDAIQEKTN
ncbi:MAG: hypothetical protein R3286_01260 [Gammaproteobacteria bacterium]|nr:hypothetical protein [Gammaproteobacteria bacterium]